MKRKLPKKKALKKRQPFRSSRTEVPIANLSKRSEEARDRAMHAIAWKRRNPRKSFTYAAKLHGVKPATIKKHFPSALTKVNGRLQVTSTDRYSATLYVPDANAIDKTTPTAGEPMRTKELPPSVLLYTPSPLDPA